MDTLQVIIKAVGGVLVLATVFTVTAMFLTSLSWIVGLITGRSKRTFPANPLNATGPRRWLLWVVASAAAFIGVNLFAKDLPGWALIVSVPGVMAAQVSAYWIGEERGARTAQRGPQLVSAANTQPWDAPPVATPDAGFLPDTHERHFGPSQTEAIAQAEAEGYIPARPTEDCGGTHEERTDRW